MFCVNESGRGGARNEAPTLEGAVGDFLAGYGGLQRAAAGYGGPLRASNSPLTDLIWLFGLLG